MLRSYRILSCVKRARNPYPNRQSFRLKRYDYSAPDAYFVTIVAEHRLRMFGFVNCGVMHLSPLGAMVHSAITGMSRWYPGVRIDAFQVMPDHIHVVVWLTAATTGPSHRDATDPISNVVAPRLTLPDVVQRLKSFTTGQYRHGAARSRWRSIGHRLWQRNYYESIIRKRAALDAIRRYIRNNPPNWSRPKRYKK